MPSIKRVISYTGLNIKEALELPCDLFQLALKNAIIEELSQTEEGRNYLKDCKRLQITEPDMVSIEKHWKVGEE